jgi:hypothetical protein
MRPGIETLLPLVPEVRIGIFGLAVRKDPAWLGLEKLLAVTLEGVLRLPDRDG